MKTNILVQDGHIECQFTFDAAGSMELQKSLVCLINNEGGKLFFDVADFPQYTPEFIKNAIWLCPTDWFFNDGVQLSIRSVFNAKHYFGLIEQKQSVERLCKENDLAIQQDPKTNRKYTLGLIGQNIRLSDMLAKCDKMLKECSDLMECFIGK